MALGGTPARINRAPGTPRLERRLSASLFTASGPHPRRLAALTMALGGTPARINRAPGTPRLERRLSASLFTASGPHPRRLAALTMALGLERRLSASGGAYNSHALKIYTRTGDA